MLRHPGRFFVILLMSGFICNQINLHGNKNILKRTDSMMLTKTILESTYKVLKS